MTPAGCETPRVGRRSAADLHGRVGGIGFVSFRKRFSLTTQDVIAVEPFEFVSPVMRYFGIPFARLRTVKEGELADFLLWVSGQGFSMSAIRQQSGELLAKLRETFPSALQG